MSENERFLLLLVAVFLVSIAFGMLAGHFVTSRLSAPAEVRK